jgi:hypothetical protein
MIRIPIPPDLPLKEFLRLRSHADWYLHTVPSGRTAAAADRRPAIRRLATHSVDIRAPIP